MSYSVLSGAGAPIPLEVPEGAFATFDPATQVVVVTRPGKDTVGFYLTTNETTGQAMPVTLIVDAAGNPVLDAENKATVSSEPVSQELSTAIFNQLLVEYAEIRQR